MFGMSQSQAGSWPQISTQWQYTGRIGIQKEQAETWAAQVIRSKTNATATWTNLQTVLLTKVSYPLMISMFTHKEGDAIYSQCFFRHFHP